VGSQDTAQGTNAANFCGSITTGVRPWSTDEDKSVWLEHTLVELMAIRSLSGREQGAIAFLESEFSELGWVYELLPVADDRTNIFVAFGKPRLIFTTHVDVVPAPDRLFVPRVEDGVIHGRGSNDAKGIAVCMIAAARDLLAAGKSDFGLLFVLEEETTGNGALAAARDLAGRGIEFLVNGEPTEGKLAIAHKGGVSYTITVEGKSCHSGYPELGKSASEILVAILSDLLAASYGEDKTLGVSTINIGTINSGTASNIVPDFASAQIMIRTVDDNNRVKRQVEDIVANRASLTLTYDAKPVRMGVAGGFDTTVVSYCTDVPHFESLGATCFLYGPGTIHRAHTDEEHVLLKELIDAVAGYVRLYDHCSLSLSSDHNHRKGE
jgi:acetylornithine deacetylase